MATRRKGRELSETLGGALNAGPVPNNGRELVRYAGGRRGLTEALSGMTGPPVRGSYRDEAAFAAARTRWRTASQAALRYDKEQRVTPALPAAVKTRVRRVASAAKRRLIGERGMRARMFARIRVPSPGRRGGDERDRLLPSGGPGVFIEPRATLEVLDRIGDRELDEAAEEFTEAFFAAYGFEDGEIVAVYWLKVWPEGTREPA